MAGVLVDVLIERLATLALDKVERELKLVVGVKQEIKNLTKKLIAIRAVLEDAEQRQVMEASVKLWLDELNDVSFDMDDVLDEWITRVEKHLLEKQEAHGADVVMATKKMVCFPFPSSCFRFGQVNYQLFLRHEIAKKIEELNGRLDLIDKNKQSFNFQLNTPKAVPEVLQRPKTTSLPNASTFGRDSDKNLIISKLLRQNSEESKVPLIVPVVGLGGMGKTCLANLVYNEIKTHFDKSIWVCVSDPFDEIKIAQAIIEELDKNNSSKSSNVLQTLTQCIFDLIKGKKFLLVLDDVWYPRSSQWEEFIKTFRNGVVGSRVLVTTRNEDVATLMNATTELVPLKGLGEAFCLSLFYHSADMVESSVSKEFYDIGLEIVKRCNGLPLAAKTLGSLMRNKKDNIREWRDVLKNSSISIDAMVEMIVQLKCLRTITLVCPRGYNGLKEIPETIETLQALFCSKFYWLDSPRQDAPQSSLTNVSIAEENRTNIHLQVTLRLHLEWPWSCKADGMVLWEEALTQKLVRGDMRNLGLEVSRQFHLQERLKRQVREYQAYLMKKVEISLEKKLAAPAMSLSSEFCLFNFTTVNTRILVFKGSLFNGVSGALFPLAQDFVPLGFNWARF
ncbi:hypothetical protein ACLB2K_070122 [Fragaria x ananassa]